MRQSFQSTYSPADWMSNHRDLVVMLHHTGYTVSDLERSLLFYRDLLGCEVVATQEKQGGYLAEIVGYSDAHVRMAHLRAPESGHIIELFQYLAPASEPSAGRRRLEPRNVGTAHMCFVVSDLTATYDRLLAAGVEFVSPPVAIDTGINAGGYALYLRDPDGIPMELFQLPVRS
ncbi:MAG TPA: VOC family protein [Solirubrobacteraceae bacterium]